MDRTRKIFIVFMFLIAVLFIGSLLVNRGKEQLEKDVVAGVILINTMTAPEPTDTATATSAPTATETFHTTATPSITAIETLEAPKATATQEPVLPEFQDEADANIEITSDDKNSLPEFGVSVEEERTTEEEPSSFVRGFIKVISATVLVILIALLLTVVLDE